MRLRISFIAGADKGNLPRDFGDQIVAPHDVHETLRRFGLEYKTADYLFGRRVIIIIDPYFDQEDIEAKLAKVRNVTDLLQEALDA
jgi:hypothetical protein